MASFQLDNDEVVREVLRKSGLGRDASQMDSDIEADVRSIIRSGLRRFYFPVIDGASYQWKFLEEPFDISAEAVFDEGTIEVSGGTVTLTGDTWPADIIDHYLDVAGDILFVTSRDSDTTLTIPHDQLTVAAGTSYEAPRYRYALPSDFGEFLGGLVYHDGSENWILIGSSEAELRLRYAIGYENNANTSHYAIFDGKIWFWPTPEPDAFIRGVYLKIPDDNLPADLTSSDSTVQATPIYAEAMLHSILAAAEDFNDDNPSGVSEIKFQTAVRAAMTHDRSTQGHFDFSRRAGRGERELVINPITFEP